MKRPLLEVIAASVADAKAAQAGGADRLEIVRELGQGGLTPPLGLVEEIAAAVEIPIRVMLRETPDFDPTGIDRLAAYAERLSRLGADGAVLGFTRDGGIDTAALSTVLGGAPGLKATFHRAFEALADRDAAIEILAETPQVDRILTSGDADELGRLQRLGGDRLTIIAGGGMDAAGVRDMLERTAVREFHIGRAARKPPESEATVSAEAVRRFRQKAGI